VDGDAEVPEIALRLGPVAAVNAAVFRRDSGVIVDQRGLDGGERVAVDDAGAEEEPETIFGGACVDVGCLWLGGFALPAE